jgi:EAL domain-containing protein (putative c-di-GMP-specific phosphodiesterase class I)
MRSQPAMLSPSQQPGMATAPQRRVLIVDDDEALAAVFASTLNKANYEVVCAPDGANAARVLQAESFDVIVSDISMPGMDGIELLHLVREHDLDVPVILVTGEPEVGSARRAVEYGALRYLEKPVSPQLLREVVGRAVQLHELARIKRDALAVLRDRAREASDRAGLEAAFTEAIGSLRMNLQPIVQCSARTVYGYEALVRSSSTKLPNAGVLHEAAERLERMQELGRTVRCRVAQAIAFLPRNLLVFVNLHPLELADDELYSPSATLSSHAAQVVLEVTERSRLEQVPGLDDRLGALRSLGYRLAVDDLGAGYAGLTSFVRLDPEFVKIDMSLIRDVHRSETKQRLVRSTCDLCREMSIRVIGEGVETKDEFRVLVDVGADLLQGYLFGKPSDDFRPVPQEVFEI